MKHHLCLFINSDLSTFKRAVPDCGLYHDFAMQPMFNVRKVLTPEQAIEPVPILTVRFKRISPNVFMECDYG